MDISSLLTDLLSGGNVKEISKESGATQKDVKSVLSAALPLIAEGNPSEEQTREVAQKTGVDLSKVIKIITAALPLLQGCEAHCTVIQSEQDSSTYARLGMHITCSPKYQTNKLYQR